MKNIKNALNSYVSNKIVKYISKNKKLLMNLSTGIDVRGTFFLLNNSDLSEIQEIVEFIKEIGGFVIPYSNHILIVLSEILGCDDIFSVEKLVIASLNDNQLIYMNEQGETLFGALDTPNPIIAGGILNKMMLNLHKLTH